MLFITMKLRLKLRFKLSNKIDFENVFKKKMKTMKVNSLGCNQKVSTECPLNSFYNIFSRRHITLLM